MKTDGFLIWKWIKVFLITVSIVIGLWILLEIGLRIYVESPLKIDFYGSLPRELVAERQSQYGVKVLEGPGWVHLGWIADPEKESYSIRKLGDGKWQEIGRAEFGSFVSRDNGGLYRVVAEAKDRKMENLVGEARAMPQAGSTLLYVPYIAGKWSPVFKPHIYGYYINDHTVYQDASGDWRLVGITHKSDGNYAEEKYFAVGVSKDFPPETNMRESGPVADFGVSLGAACNNGERHLLHVLVSASSGAYDIR